ncbi:hypothetical protein C5S39_04360 [Candidatus Methanophagaceae archaeon]|nr:hypothetical protein C5S39_04360 [Methanophagales archaeon]
MAEKHRFSKQCVYTLRKRDNLEFIYRSSGTGTFRENKNWKIGYSLFMDAKERQEKMPILFSAAEESSGLIYYALLESITINKEHGIYRTTYSFSHLTPLSDTKPRSSLVLLSTGKPLSNNYIRPYAVCRTPDWLKEIEQSGLPPIEKVRKAGTERFHKDGTNLNCSLVEFWQWSASDLVSNALRGILAEYIVAHALDLADAVRFEWDAYDLLLPNGIKIEVKSAAYIQSWYQKGYSKISFAIRKTSEWNEETNRQSRAMKRHADIYVFCLLKHTIQETIDPLDVTQWEYYVLPTSVLDDKMGDQKQISLQAVKKLDPLQVPYEDLSSCIGHLAVEIDLNRNRGSK